ncbi:MAG TPA: alpha/beta hydrolase [Steroidobacteraceae bacterium]|nr:alpha/beta hydrolase [Steroidobacteraceae bacterium]
MTCTVQSIVLVHGAWHGSWCWARVVPLLEERGFIVRAVDLPSIGADSPPAADLSADAAEVRKAIEGTPGEVLVCGHSYGGMVLSHPEVGTHPRVAQLVYVCAFVPERGQSLFAIGGGKPAPWIRVDERGMTLPDLEQAAELLYGDCDPETQRWAIGNLRRQPAAPFAEPVADPAWLRTRSTYIVCTRDRVMPLELQRCLFAARTGSLLELEAGHSPFLSRPAELARHLAGCGSIIPA